MSLLIHDELLSRQLIDRRRDGGLDRYDEVWDGVYVMPPIANNEHQSLITEVAAILRAAIDWKQQGCTLAGANVSDQLDDWTQNYRVPDVLVFLNGSTAENRSTHWLGGPDFAIEVTSKGDRTLDKLDFYAKVNTRELLVIDRKPWQLSLYRLSPTGRLELVKRVNQTEMGSIVSEVVPIELSLDFDAGCLRVRCAEANIDRSFSISRH